MHITWLETRYFGVLGSHRHIRFQPGFNAVVGGAGTGKTTIVQALTVALQGPEDADASLWQSRDTSDPVQVSLGLEGPFGQLVVERNLSDGSVRLVVPGESSPLYHGLDAVRLQNELEHIIGSPLGSWVLERKSGFELPEPVHQLFVFASSQKRARERRQVADEIAALEARKEDLTEKLAALPQAGEGGDRLAAARAEVEALGKDIARRESELASLETRLQVLQKRAGLDRKMDALRENMSAVSQLEDRLDALTRRLQTDFAHFEAHSGDLPQQLATLAEARQELDNHRAALVLAEEDAAAARQEIEETRAHLARRHPDLANLDASFPDNLRRYRELADELKSRQEDITPIESQLGEVAQRLEAEFSNFQGTPDDFLAQLDTLATLQTQLGTLKEDLANEKRAVQSLEESLEGLDETLARHAAFDAVGEDFADKLPTYVKSRDLLESREALVGETEERLRLVSDLIKRNYGAVSGLPQDYQLSVERLRQAHAELEARLKEMAEQQQTWEEVSKHRDIVHWNLEKYQGLEQRPDHFPEELVNLITARQERASLIASVADVNDKIAALKVQLEGEMAQFRHVPEDYPRQIDDLRRLNGEHRARQEELEAELTRRHNLSTEITDLEGIVKSELSGFEQAADDFPTRVTEFFRLREASEKLQQQVDACKAQIARQQEKIESTFAALMALPARTRERLEELRPQHEVLRQIMERLQWELSERERLQADIAALEEALQGPPEGETTESEALRLVLEAQRRDLETRADTLAELSAAISEKRGQLRSEGDAPLVAAERLATLEKLARARDERQERDKSRYQLEGALSAAQSELEAHRAATRAAAAGLGDDVAEKVARLDAIMDSIDALEDGDEDALETALAVLQARGQKLLAEFESTAGPDVEALLQQYRDGQTRERELALRVETLTKAVGDLPPAGASSLEDEAHALGLPDLYDGLDEQVLLVRQLIKLEGRHEESERTLQALKSWHRRLEEQGSGAHAEKAARLAEARLRLSLLQPAEADTLALEQLRRLLLADIETLGLNAALPDPSDRLSTYLSYQAAITLLEAYKTELTQLLRGRSGGNDLERMEKKLEQMKKGLRGVDLDRPLEDLLADHRRWSGLQDRIGELQRTLDGLRPEADIHAAVQADQQAWRDALGRLDLHEGDDLDQLMKRYHAWRQVVSELNGLEAARRVQLHAEPDEDGKEIDDLARLDERIAALEESTAPFHARVESTADVTALIEEFEDAREQATEYKKLAARLASLKTPDELEEARLEIQETYAGQCIDAGLTPEQVLDDALLAAWRELRDLEEEKHRQEALLERHLEREEGPEGSTSTILERLQAEVDELAGAMGGFLDATDPERILSDWREYVAARTEATRLREKLSSRVVPSELEQRYLDTSEKVASLRETLKLEDDPRELSVIRDHYTLYKRCQQEQRSLQRTLKRLLAAEQTESGTRTILDRLKLQMDELRPLLGGHERNGDLNAAIEAWQQYQQEVELIGLQEEQVQQLLDSNLVAVKLTQDRVRELEIAIGPWMVDRDIEEALEEYGAYKRVLSELETLQGELDVHPALDVLNEQLAKMQATRDALPASEGTVADTDGALADARGQLNAQRQKKAALEQILASLNGLLVHGGSNHAAPGDVLQDLEARLSAMRSALSGLDSGAEAGLDPYEERCWENVSTIMHRITQGRYRKVWLEHGKPMLTPARGPDIAAEKVAMVRDQLDLWWHLAWVEVLGETYPWPLVLDNPLGSLDTARSERTVELLMEHADKRQIILLTSDRAPIGSLSLAADLDAGVKAVAE